MEDLATLDEEGVQAITDLGGVANLANILVRIPPVEEYNLGKFWDYLEKIFQETSNIATTVDICILHTLDAVELGSLEQENPHLYRQWQEALQAKPTLEKLIDATIRHHGHTHCVNQDCTDKIKRMYRNWFYAILEKVEYRPSTGYRPPFTIVDLLGMFIEISGDWRLDKPAVEKLEDLLERAGDGTYTQNGEDLKALIKRSKLEQVSDQVRQTKAEHIARKPAM